VVAALLAGPMSQTASAAVSPDAYASAVRDCLTYVQFAEKGDQPSLRRAFTALGPIARQQPEILADLEHSPPDLRDADDRLTALLQALHSPADTPDPVRARGALQHILALPRYAGMTQGLPLWLLILGSILRFLRQVLAALGITRAGIPLWVWVGIVVVAVVVVITVLGRALVSRRRGDVTTHRRTGQAIAPTDFFARADQAAAARDYAEAVRWLAGGVAAAIGGESAWRKSPLTVRELFSGSQQTDALRPLLHSFEAAVYGHRVPSEGDYRDAAAAASPFRRAA
jgi:hypothetical protein